MVDSTQLHIPFQPILDKWEPPDELFERLADKRLRTRDKVELVYSYFAADHHGQGPYASEIAEVLGIAKQNVEQQMVKLVAEGRATKRHGRFYLSPARWTHPIVSKFSGS